MANPPAKLAEVSGWDAAFNPPVKAAQVVKINGTNGDGM